MTMIVKLGVFLSLSLLSAAVDSDYYRPARFSTRNAAGLAPSLRVRARTGTSKRTWCVVVTETVRCLETVVRTRRPVSLQKRTPVARLPPRMGSYATCCSVGVFSWTRAQSRTGWSRSGWCLPVPLTGWRAGGQKRSTAAGHAQ